MQNESSVLIDFNAQKPVMYRNFSLQKSATSLSLLFIGAAASLLGTNLLPMNNQLVKQSVAQLPAAIPGDINPNFTQDSDNTPGEPEKVGGAGIILGLAAGGSAVGAILYARKAQNSLKLSSTPSHSGLKTSSDSKENVISIDHASRKLQKKLLTILHNDRDAANRLLAQAKFRNPNKSIDWCVEKVIYDLERDRGMY